MQVTIFGLILLPICLFLAGQPIRLLQLALITQVFEAAAAMVIGGNFGLQPSLVPGLLFLGYIGLQYALGMRYPGERLVFRTLVPLLAFAGWAIGSAFVLTDVFAGTPVWPQRNEFAGIMTPLQFGMGNVTQGLYLILNIAVTVGAALFLTRVDIPYRSLLAAYLASGYLVVLLGFWQFASRLTGLWWPTEFLNTNPGWTIVEQSIGPIPRVQGPFSEPSSMGSYLAGVTFCCLWLCIRSHQVMRPRLLLCLASAGVLMSTSTSGILALVVGLPLMFTYAMVTGGGAGIQRALKTILAVVVAGIVVLGPLFLLRPEFGDAVSTIAEATLEKRESSSYEERTQADLDATEVTMATYGLGVGWGSFRSSSLIAGLLVNSGVIGLLLIIWFIVRLSRFKVRAQARTAATDPARATMDGFAAALGGGLIPALMAGPTINSLAFFIQIACLVGTASRVLIGDQRVSSRTSVRWLSPGDKLQSRAA
jgi:hypothetical protein